MIDRLKQYIRDNDLIKDSDRILVAFSGGPDSVALAFLLNKLGYDIALAHFNFKLRGKDSDEDESFARHFAKELGVEIFVNSENTVEYARQNKLSVETAARQLRYTWFSDLSRGKGFSKIATAHNADDNVETILFNISRGTGLRGLAGIPVKNGNIIRPLLFAYKHEILDFCKENNLGFRIDKTNFETEFTRNRIRHLIIPKFEEINPRFKNNVNRMAVNVRQALDFLQDSINAQLQSLMHTKGELLMIDKQRLLANRHYAFLLYEILSPLGFSADDIRNVAENLTSQPGKQFLSRDYHLVIDRDFLIIEPLREKKPVEVRVDKETEELSFPGFRLRFSEKKADEVKLPAGENVFVFDMDKIHFPLTIRSWRFGDWFIPLGMKGKKKLSDFFVDQKISRVEKDSILVMQDATGKIMWVVGYRIDDRFKITGKTTKVFQIEIIDQ